MLITKDTVINALDDLPADRLGEVLDFVMFLKQRKGADLQELPLPLVKVVPVQQLKELVGLVAWGGDALADAERLYEA